MTVMNCNCLCVRNKILKSSRHLGFTRKRKAFLSPSYHPNTVASFQLKRLAESGGNCSGVKESTSSWDEFSQHIKHWNVKSQSTLGIWKLSDAIKHKICVKFVLILPYSLHWDNNSQIYCLTCSAKPADLMH